MYILIPIILFILIAGGLTWYLLVHDRGEKEPVTALWGVLGIGFLGAVAAFFIESLLLSKNTSLSSPHLSSGLFVAAITIGLIEEACKFIPVALFLYKKRYFNEHIDGIIFFAIAGLGFGLPENILYTIQFGFTAGLSRILLTPLFHATTTALIGYFLIRSKLNRQSMWKVVLAFMSAVLLHGMYDFGLLSGVGIFIALSLIITFGLTVSLFLLFAQANRSDQEEGISAVGHNDFCRSCGHPNHKHNLYCSNCGLRA